eukprot:3020744-Rhodomonas_salina.1
MSGCLAAPPQHLNLHSKRNHSIRATLSAPMSRADGVGDGPGCSSSRGQTQRAELLSGARALARLLRALSDGEDDAGEDAESTEGSGVEGQHVTEEESADQNDWHLEQRPDEGVGARTQRVYCPERNEPKQAPDHSHHDIDSEEERACDVDGFDDCRGFAAQEHGTGEQRDGGEVDVIDQRLLCNRSWQSSVHMITPGKSKWCAQVDGREVLEYFDFAVMRCMKSR